MATTSSADQPVMDTSRRFVRVRGERANGFVEFDFAIGEPEIFVEMILGQEAFAEFCLANHVELLPAEEVHTASADEWGWRVSDATHQRFK